MEDKLQKEEISLMDLVKLLWSKVKLLILVLLCGGIIGGAFGVVTTYNENYWGTSMEFYVNPERPESDDGANVGIGGSTYGVYGAYGRHVMDNIVKLLNSESFAEKLILNDRKLPEKNVWVDVTNQNEVDLGLNQKIEEAEAEIVKAQGEQAILTAAIAAKDEISVSLAQAESALNEIWDTKLYRKGLVSNSTFNEREYFASQLGEKVPELAAAYESVEQLESRLTLENETVKICKNNYNAAKSLADKAVDTALVAWRKTEKYRSNLERILNAVEFSYLEEDADVEDAVNLARSFIYVNISVLGDENKEFSQDLMERIQKTLPSYVAEKMIIPDGYTGTSCTEITTISEISLTNPHHTTKTAIKFAILFAMAAAVVACVTIIIVDRSDKRVRDYDQVSRMLNIPLLGVIPSINDENITAWNNKTKQEMGE